MPQLSTVQNTIAFSFVRMARLLWTRRKLAKRDDWSRDELLRHQADALNSLRVHAYANSPFYRSFHKGLFDRPLQELPVLTKKELMENWDDVVTDRTLKLDEFRKFIETLDAPQLFRDQYVASTTSGSTGLKGVFAFNRDEWLWGVASHSRATSWAGADIGLLHRLRIAVVSSTQPWVKSLLVGASVDTPILPTLRLDATEPFDAIAEKLNAFQPDVLIAYAETAHSLARRQLAGELQDLAQHGDRLFRGVYRRCQEADSHGVEQRAIQRIRRNGDGVDCGRLCASPAASR